MGEDARKFARENEEVRVKNLNLSNDNAKLEGRCGDLEGEKALTNKILADTRNKLGNTERKLANKAKAAAQMEDQLAKLKYENSDLAAENAKNRSRLKELEEQLQRFLKTKNAEIEGLKN